MEKTGVALLAGAIGVLAGGLGGYHFGLQKGIEQGENNVFTNHGLPVTVGELLGELEARGYTQAMLQTLANATVWELQCLLAAHLIGEAHGIPSV